MGWGGGRGRSVGWGGGKGRSVGWEEEGVGQWGGEEEGVGQWMELKYSGIRVGSLMGRCDGCIRMDPCHRSKRMTSAVVAGIRSCTSFSPSP